MNKEELVKEAEDYAEKHYMSSYFAQADIYVNDKKEIINAILYFAEPREKQIEELNKENAVLEGKLADLQSEYIELENFHHNEINELKEQNRQLLESCEGATMMYKDLCKAKDLIAKLYHADECFTYDEEVEQFLKE